MVLSQVSQYRIVIGKIISCGHDTLVKIWDAEYGNLLMGLSGHNNMVTSLGLLHSCKKIISGSLGNIFIWDMETGELLQRMYMHGKWIRSLGPGPTCYHNYNYNDRKLVEFVRFKSVHGF
jgi:WD40 repeat protein